MKPFPCLWANSALLAVVALLSACGAMPGGKSESSAAKPATPAAAPAAAATKSKVGPGMNERGDVIDSKKVESGYGQKVKGLNDWEGEITGRPTGGKMSQLKIGMTSAQVLSIMGQPNDQGAHPTGKAFIPFYFGSDRFRYEVVYKGQGRLLFSGGGGFGWDGNTYLIWIIHSASEGSTR